MNKKMNVWLGQYISSYLDVICGAISIITFCYYRPWWDMDFRSWWLKRSLKEYKTNRGE